ncbi:unnamed protein product [Tilletia controversa]|nr:hypothetical protein CF335_g2011 [Tilletia laevis]CAD6920947.1 unnamed protein product [Tilletia caries]CAD6935291.1 unnamed protein product [Tilletia controversa]
MHAAPADEHRITADDIAEEVPTHSTDKDPNAPADADDDPMDEDEDDDDDDDDDGFNPIQDTSLSSFPAHTPSSVFSIALHPAYPSPSWALSGGEDDRAHIWDTLSGQLVAVLEGHTDSVISVGWSADGSMAASASMDGTVRVWTAAVEAGPEAEAAGHAWSVCATLEGPDEITWMSWHPKGPVLVAGAQDGTVWMWQLPSGNVMQVFSGHTAACTCGQWTPDGKRLLTASEDASLFLWDPRTPNPLSKLNSHNEPRFQPFAESGGITSLAISPDAEGGKIAVVGGANGMLRVVSLPPLAADSSLSGSMAVRAVLDGHQDGESVEAIEFIDLLGGSNTSGTTTWTSVVSVSTDGRAIVWDLSTNKARLSVMHPTAIEDSASTSDASSYSRRKPKAKIPPAPITSLAVHKGTPMFTTAAAPDPDAISARAPAAAPPAEDGSSGAPAPGAGVGVGEGEGEDGELSPHGTLCTWDARTGALLALHTGFMEGVLDVAVGVDPDASSEVSSPSVDAVAVAMALSSGSSSAGVSAGGALQAQAIRVGGGKRWTVVGAGDEGVALVFRV